MLTAHMNAVENHLLAISKIPANSGHSLHKGTPREAFIREFLESHLNTTVSIGSGEIIDSKSAPNEKRNQFDIVIYKRNYPRLDFGGGINGSPRHISTLPGPIAAGRHLGYKSLAQMPTHHNRPVSSNVRHRNPTRFCSDTQ